MLTAKAAIEENMAEEDEDFLNKTEVSEKLIKSWEDNPEIVEEIELYGTMLKEM